MYVRAPSSRIAASGSSTLAAPTFSSRCRTVEAAGDRDDVGSALQQPRECHLCRGRLRLLAPCAKASHLLALPARSGSQGS